MSALSLRVLIVGLNYWPEPTGIAPYTAGLARGLVDRGHFVRVVTTFPHYPQWRAAPGYRGWSQTEVVGGVSVQRVRHYIPKGGSGLSRAASEVSFGIRSMVTRWQSPDVVLCISPALIGSALAIARASRGRRRPAVGIVMQDLYSVGMAETVGSARAGGVLAALEGWAAREADGVAVIHDRFKRRVASSLSVPEAAIAVVRNWTHVSRPTNFERDAFRFGRGWSDKWVILHAGAMGSKQGLGNVVEAARYASVQGWDLHFVLMGDGKERTVLEVQALGMDNVEFLDPLPDEDYRCALQAADVLLVNEKPGVTEMAVPSKLTSYFSSGVPVLAATESTSTTAEEIAASRAGIRIQPGDPPGLAEAARAMCSDTLRAAALGAAGPRYCSEVLSEEQAIDGYEAWIRDLMDRARVRRGEE